MKKNLCIFLILIFFSHLSVGWSADFQKGLTAAQKGDFATALSEWKPLAELDYAPAQYNLGVMFDDGNGVVQNYKTALKWYTLAAGQGYAPAQFNLGVMFNNGDGVVQNYNSALKWYTLAAEQGYAPAQFNLGTMFYNGNGVIQDNIYAHMWWNISASNGNKNASKYREIIAKTMTSTDSSSAQKLARDCVKKKYKGC